jgi:hypothetical protein
VIYIPILYWFNHSKVNRGDIQTHREHGDRISLRSVFQSKESRLIIDERILGELHSIVIKITKLRPRNIKLKRIDKKKFSLILNLRYIIL